MIYITLFIIYFIILGVAIVNDKELLGIFSSGSMVIITIFSNIYLLFKQKNGIKIKL